MKPYDRWSLSFLVGVMSVLISPSAAQADSIVFVQCGPPCGNQIPQPNTDFLALSTGNYQTLGLRSNGSVAAWGFCGKDSCEIPSPNSGFTAIASGDAFNLFMRPGGVIQVRGSNESAQHDVPPPNSGYVAFAAGLLHAVALRSNGTIAAWGYCGPTVPAPNSDWIAVAAGGYSSMGLKSDGTLYKWGCFFEPGQVIEPGTHFTAMACHANHALAVREDGSIYAWGNNNDFGQLNVPLPNADFVSVACTYEGSVALKADGSIMVWGNIAAVAEPNNNFVSISADNWFAWGLRSNIPVTPGDCDGDGSLNPDDIPCFTDALLGTDTNPPGGITRSDMNASGTTDGVDIQPFVTALLVP